MLSLYKKKSLNFSSAVDSRVLRAHRRTLDRKDIRHEQLSRRRNIGSSKSTTSCEVEPLAELHVEFHKPINSGGLKNQSNEPSSQETSKAINRREMLKKWKTERDFKKKIEMNKHKPVFKVGHVDHDPPRYLMSSSSKVLKKENTNTSKMWNLKTSVKNSFQSENLMQTKQSQQTTNLQTQTTGSSIRSTKPSHPKQNTTTRKMETSKQGEMRAQFPVVGGPVTRSKTSHLKVQKCEEIRTQEMLQSSSGKIGNENPKKDVCSLPAGPSPLPETPFPADISIIKKPPQNPSFAPTEYSFTAPNNLVSFNFNPVSPAVGVSFLCPPEGLFSNISRRASSTPIKSDSPLLKEQLLEMITSETTSATSSSEEEIEKTKKEKSVNDEQYSCSDRINYPLSENLSKSSSDIKEMQETVLVGGATAAGCDEDKENAMEQVIVEQYFSNKNSVERTFTPDNNDVEKKKLHLSGEEQDSSVSNPVEEEMDQDREHLFTPFSRRFTRSHISKVGDLISFSPVH
ncbi:uncharacterized protein LOC143233670 isoform X1 [Tachypleus tridentatus]|uniref:uncharacterized protein LOC143233670 isoform X1 n=1 Tax=Tachypleus tridentatus TaxID=6853 RepID=UPI003FD1952D